MTLCNYGLATDNTKTKGIPNEIVALYFWHLTTGNIHHNEHHQNKGK